MPAFQILLGNLGIFNLKNGVHIGEIGVNNTADCTWGKGGKIAALWNCTALKTYPHLVLDITMANPPIWTIKVWKRSKNGSAYQIAKN